MTIADTSTKPVRAVSKTNISLDLSASFCSLNCMEGILFSEGGTHTEDYSCGRLVDLICP